MSAGQARHGSQDSRDAIPTEITPPVRYSETPDANDLAYGAPTASRGNAGIDALRAWRENGGTNGPRRNPIEKLADNPTSLRLAVNAKCFDCMGQDADPGYHRRIRECGCTSCPLHAVRPFQRHGDDE